MSKAFDEKGNFSEEGKRLCIDLRYGLEQLMSSDEVKEMNENELHILGGLLAKMVGEAVSNRISFKRHLQGSLDAMSDEQFESYLKEKYGTIWNLVTLTEEEYRRCPTLSQEKIEELLKKGAEKVGHPPCNGVRFERNRTRYK